MARSTKKIGTNGKAHKGEILPPQNGKPLSTNEMRDMFGFIRRMVANQEFSRAAFVQSMGAQDWRKIDKMCCYPETITYEMCKWMYDHEGMANRVIGMYPRACWSAFPWVYETEAVEGDAQTPFEKKLKQIQEEFARYTNLAALDEVAGIGRYGVMLIGVDDNPNLKAPFPGIDRNGETVGEPKPHNLLYLQSFPEGFAKVVDCEQATNCKRYGQPLHYNLTVVDAKVPNMT